MNTRIQRQLDYLEENDMDLIGSNIRNMDVNGVLNSKATIYPESSELIAKKARYNSPMAHPTWFGKRTVYEKLNGYQEIEACEDYDFIVRAIINGFKLANVQDTLLYYRLNENGISSTKRAKQKAALYYVRENYKRGRITEEEEFRLFFDSERGRKKIASLSAYYGKKRKIDSMKRNKIGKLLYGGVMWLSMPEARQMLINNCLDRIVVR